MSDSFQIVYAAHTTACTFLLDEEGVCRRIVLAPVASSRRALSARGRDEARTASQCVGTQYVAALDPTVTGMLAEMPRVGAAMLFARVDERGRVSLVRTGIVTRFESHRADEDPFAEQRPSESVKTSAPPITPSMPARRPAKVPEVRMADFIRIAEDEDDDDPSLDKTAEYHSEAGARRVYRAAPATLRQPPIPTAEDDNPYAQGPAPQRSDPYLTRTRPLTAPPMAANAYRRGNR